MSAPIAAIDTETTGLGMDDEVWEFAGFRRDADGRVSALQLFIGHDTVKCNQLPGRYLQSHVTRWLSAATAGQIVSPLQAANRIADFLKPADDGELVHVIGCAPAFDERMLRRLLQAHGLVWPVSHHLIDVVALMLGHLAHEFGGFLPPPWRSDDLSRNVGVAPPVDDRHTAVGDARWALAIYDQIMRIGYLDDEAVAS